MWASSMAIYLGQVEQRRQSVFACARGGNRKCGRIQPGAVEDGIIVMLRQRYKLPFRVDDDLLDQTMGLFEDTPKRPALARAGRPLDEKATVEQLFEVEADHAPEVGKTKINVGLRTVGGDRLFSRAGVAEFGGESPGQLLLDWRHT
jgi:hypothetical protein